MTQSWMSGRLTGRTPMTIDDLELIAQVLDVSLTRLMGFEGEDLSKRRFSPDPIGVSQRVLVGQAA